MSNFAAIQGKRERVEALRKAIRQLREKKEQLGQLRMDSVAAVSYSWWRGEHQEKFVDDLQTADAIKSRLNEAIDTAINDYNSEIRTLEIDMEVLSNES